MTTEFSYSPPYAVLTTGNGCRCGFVGLDDDALRAVELLTAAMQLPLHEQSPDLLIAARSGYEQPRLRAVDRVSLECWEVPILRAAGDPDAEGLQLQQLATATALILRRHASLLVHGVLLCSPVGHGIILAGTAGSGKTTTSAAVQAPWEALTDDACLVSRTDAGWQVQPWPTFSRFQFGGPGGSWDCNHDLPLQAVHLLRKGPTEKMTPLGAGAAVGRLLTAVEDLGRPVLPVQKPELQRQYRLLALDLVSQLARDLACFELQTRRGKPITHLLADASRGDGGR